MAESGAAAEGTPDPRRRSALERLHWEGVSAAAARDLPPGRVGGVVAQLRQRGRVANRRANVFLAVLIVTVLTGLGYYIGLPIWRAYADGTIRTLQEQIKAAEAENAALDGRRTTIIDDLKETLRLSPVVVRARSETGEGFYTPLALADGTLIATGGSGTILRSTDGGATWGDVRARSETGEWFDTPLALADGTLIATGGSGTILRLSGDTATRLGALADGLTPGNAGDAKFASFFPQLDLDVQILRPVAEARDSLEALTNERLPVEAGLARARERLAEWRSGQAAVEMRQRAFAAFMESCRAGAAEPTDAAVTTACLAAFAASEADTRRDWWETLAEQVPPGILLLFLLATLSGLYRYNVRLAGFHDGRADALELMVAEAAAERLTPLSDALAADKVEFGAAKTPTDHAAEMATALINRVK